MTTLADLEPVEDVDGATLPEPGETSAGTPLAMLGMEIYEPAFAPVRRDPATGRLLTDSTGRELPEDAESDQTSWRTGRRTPSPVTMPEGVFTYRTHEGDSGCWASGEGFARGLGCTRSHGHAMPHRGGTGGNTLTGEWGFNTPPIVVAPAEQTADFLVDWEEELLASTRGSIGEPAPEPPGHPELDLPGSPAGALLRSSGAAIDSTDHYDYRVVTTDGRVLGGRSWGYLQGTYDSQQEGVDEYRDVMNFVLVNPEWPGEAGAVIDQPSAPASPAVTPTADPADVPAGRPEGVLLRIPSAGYRVATPDGAVYGDRGGNWGNFQSRLTTQQEAVDYYVREHRAAVVNGLVHPVPVPVPAPQHQPNIRINYRPRGGGDWGREQIDIWVPELDRSAELTHGANVERIREAIDDFRAANGQERLRTGYFWLSEHVALLPATPAAQAAPVNRTTTSTGEALRMEHTISSPTGWATCKPAGDGEAYRANPLTPGHGHCAAHCPRDLMNSTNYLGPWVCSRPSRHTGYHAAYGSASRLLAEWDMEPELVPAATPVPFTSSGGTVLPEHWFRNSPNGLDWSGSGRLPEGGYAMATAGIEVEVDSRGTVCSSEVPLDLGDTGHYWVCTREDGHEGHHVATYRGDQVLAEWGRRSPATAAPATPATPEPQLNLLAKADVARVMKRFALMRRGDNSIEALQKGLSRLGIDLDTIETTDYEAVLNIRVPIQVRHASLGGLTRYQLQDAFPAERVHSVVQRFLQALKLEGESFSNVTVQGDRISTSFTDLREI